MALYSVAVDTNAGAAALLQKNFFVKKAKKNRQEKAWAVFVPRL
jgi:hypothetical protein